MAYSSIHAAVSGQEHKEMREEEKGSVKVYAEITPTEETIEKYKNAKKAV